MKLKLNGFLVLLVALVTQITFAQERTVSGVVSDNAGMPLPGASVLIKGTKSGAQTDFDGKYAIKVAPNQTLVFSYIGMQTKEVAASSTTINVKLKDSSVELEGVVVTALGVKKSEKALGYAAQSIKGSDMTEARENNLVNSLSGKIAGVQITNSSGGVGASSRIVLRGSSSITGNNEALFVVDGVPFDNSTSGDSNQSGGQDMPNGVASISPDDIESITVLKGPNAAALYGLRASNGVILINTKSGKSGRMSVTFNTNATFSNPLVLPDFQNSYGQGSTSDSFKFVNGAGGGYNDGVDESWGPALDKGLSFVQWDSYKVNGAPLPWISHPNNVKDFYETAVSLTNNLSLSGGTEKSNFKMSIGNSDEKGMLPSTDFKKINVSLNGNLQISDKIKSGASVMFFNDKSNSLPTVGYNNENAAQQFLWSARNVNFADLKDFNNLPLAPAGTAAAGTPLNWNTNFQNNPYWVLATNRTTFDKNRLTGSAFIAYEFSKDLTAKGKASIDHFSQLITGRQAIGSNNAPNGSYNELANTYSEINTEAILSYKKTFLKDFDFSLNFGANHMRRKTNLTFGSLPALELPNLYNLANIKTGSVAVLDNEYKEIRIGSLFSFGQISYKNLAFLEFSGRNDWSSILPVKNNSFFYPSLTGSLVLSELIGMNESKINYLKIRGGWSKVGGTGALDAYKLNLTYSLQNSGWGNQASTPNTQYNPNLKPESVVGTEIGFDVNGFKNRLRFAGTYYTKISSDLLVPIQVSAASGYTSVWDNIASMENKGIELQLGVTAVKTNDFSFDIDLNFAKNNSEVTSLGGLDSYVLGGQWGVTLEARVGEPYGALVGRGFQKDGNGNVIYENGLPLIESTKKVLGNITPDWTGGANFTFKYKQFDLNTLIDAKVGGDVHSMTYAWGRYAGTLSETLIGRETGVVGEGVMSDGNGGYIKNNVVIDAKEFNQTAYGNTIEESAIFDATYIKLRQVSLGYSLPKKWLDGLSIDNLKFSIVARNLAILYKAAPHIDPETGFSNSNGNQGMEFGQLPSARSIGVNMSVKF